MVALSTLASGATTATVGTAWLSVHSRSLVLESSRARIPVTTTKTAAIAVTTAKMPNLRRETGEFCSVGMRGLRCGGSFGALSLVYHTKDHGKKHQGTHGCEYPPSPSASALGVIPIIIASAVISTGRKRTKPASIAAAIGSPSSS